MDALNTARLPGSSGTVGASIWYIGKLHAILQHGVLYIVYSISNIEWCILSKPAELELVWLTHLVLMKKCELLIPTWLENRDCQCSGGILLMQLSVLSDTSSRPQNGNGHLGPYSIWSPKLQESRRP